MNSINQIFNQIINFLKKYKIGKLAIDIFINGNIPYFNFIRKYLVYISAFSIIIFLFPKMFKDFGEYSYNLLIFILLISPISKIFPKFKILNKILVLRKQIGIIIGFFLIAHLIGFFLKNNINFFDFIYSEIFNYKNFYFWGIWGAIFMLFPFITSNNFSVKLLKSKWKFFQYGTYLFFIFSVFHVYTLKGEIEELAVLFIWIFLKFLAYKKVVILR